MKIAIEARAATHVTGVGTYVRELLARLPAAVGTDEIVEAPKPYSELLLPWWLHHTIPNYLASTKPDIAHFTKADVPKKKVVPTVATIYDIIPLLLPESQSLLRRRYWPRALARAATLSDHILTISEASKRGIAERLSVSPENITVTPLAVNLEHFRPSNVSESAPPYILFVGRWDTRKNIPALIKAFAKIAETIPHTLVIAGRPADKPVDLYAVVSEMKMADRIEFRENVPYQGLPQLYAGADLFVYPSILEGWGFPPQEAMACGTPVIVSDGDPLPEVVGSAGGVVPFSSGDLQRRLADDSFVERLADRMQAVLGNEEKLRTMREAGLAHVQTFSWDAVVQKTAAVYRQLL